VLDGAVDDEGADALDADDAGPDDVAVVVDALDCDEPPQAAVSASAASPTTTRRRSKRTDSYSSMVARA